MRIRPYSEYRLYMPGHRCSYLPVACNVSSEESILACVTAVKDGFGREGELDGILVYFASDASSYCTGQTIYVDGGSTLVL